MGEIARDRRRHEREVRRRCFLPGGGFTPFPEETQGLTLWRRFAEVAGRFPHRRAVVEESATLDYLELATAAARIAGALDAFGRSARGPVGILLPAGGHAFAATLGTLKLGRSYLPLDPDYPAPRLGYMFEDCGAAVLITSRRYRETAGALGADADQTLYVEDIVEDSAPHTGDAGDSGDDALVLYTSGSTGKPKGFTQTHRNLLHDVMHYTNAAHFCPEDRFLMVSSISFAGSLRTIYGALLNGACLYPHALRERGLLGLESWISEHDITIYRSVPTLFRQFVSILSGDTRFPSLRLIYLAGEPVYRSDFELYRRHFADSCVLVNRIGSGEALTFRCYFMDKHTRVDGSLVPVGYDVPDNEVVLLDESQNIVAQPGTGEIALRSSYVTPGYINNPTANAASFLVPTGTGGTLLRTGDIGKVLADGCLIHLGRRDFQVKIRGARVEIGDIETTLMAHPGVREAIVSPSKDAQGNTTLTAYVTETNPGELSTTRLMRFLEDELPYYMVPARFALLDRLPQTASGKVDRRNLPPLDDARPALDNILVLPRNDTERRLAGLWSEVLNVATIGVHDRFTELGGNSIQAMTIIARVLDDTGTTLSMKDVLLEAATVAEMSAVIEQGPSG